jgi:hypothetical protein
MPEPSEVYDVFLSHGSPDKPWVETLARELEGLGLKPFLDARAIEPAANFPLVLSDALAAYAGLGEVEKAIGYLE